MTQFICHFSQIISEPWIIHKMKFLLCHDLYYDPRSEKGYVSPFTKKWNLKQYLLCAWKLFRKNNMKTKYKPVHISLLFHATCGRLYTSIMFQNEPVNKYLLPPFLGYLDKWSIDMNTHQPFVSCGRWRRMGGISF